LAGAAGAVATALDRADPGGGGATAVAEDEEEDDAEDEAAGSGRSFFASAFSGAFSGDFSGDLATGGLLSAFAGYAFQPAFARESGPVAGYSDPDERR
jgi:hypothetical protein